MSEKIKVGDKVSVNYTGKFENGEVFDSSEGRAPLEFTVGAGELIKGFDQAVVGMAEGEKKSVHIEAQDAYGERSDDRVFDLPKDRVPEDMNLEVGMQVQLNDKDNNPVPAVVSAIKEDAIELDVNHPLAGKVLQFDIEIVGIGL